MIQRLLKNDILKLLKQFPVVVMSGARQIGKSTLAKQIASERNKHILYFDLERPSERRKLEDAETVLSEAKDKLTIIDEAQTMPELFSTLRPLIDDYRKPGRFLLLGSVSPFLIRQVAQTLAGRVAHVELSSINIVEAKKSKISLKHLWFRGGYPEPLNYKKNEQWYLWMKNYEQTFVERDVTFLMNESLSTATVRKIWSMLSYIHGQLLNYEDISRSLGLSRATVIKYIDFLEAAFLVRRLSPWYFNTSKRIVKSSKIYFRDSGLLHAMHDIKEYNQLLGHIIIGTSWEGFVIEQIHQFTVGNANLYFYRTHHGAEADLVLVKGHTPICSIEIKVNNSPPISKGFFNCIEDLKTKHNFVITPSSSEYKNKNIVICSLITFIEKHLKKII